MPQLPLQTDAAVIGAGPAGLYQVFQLGLQGLRAHVFDALPAPGGQCAQLYGDKPIYDIPALPACTGNELVQRLSTQIQPFAPQWQLGAPVEQLEALPEGGFLLRTAQGTAVQARCMFIASGVGAFVPRTLKLPGLEVFGGTQLLHQLPPRACLAGLRIVIHGGGEAAVQQAIDCATAPEARRAAHITLQHRRDVFDAPPQLLAQLHTLRAAGRIEVAIGVASGAVQQQGRLTALEILPPEGPPRQIPLDQLIVRLGLVPRLGPIADWGLQLERKQLVVDPATFATSVPGIYAVGDAVSYPGKRKLIACGFHEATLAAFAAAEWLAGDKIGLEYTSSSALLQQRLGVS